MAEEDDLLIDLNQKEETGEEKKEEAAAAATKPPPVPGPGLQMATPERQPGLDDLKTQIENVRRERDEQAVVSRRMQEERDRWAAYAQEAERRGVSAWEVAADTKINSINSEMEALASQQESAMSESDFKTIAQINLKLGKLGGDLAQANRDKLMAAQNREQLTRRQQQQPQQRQQPQQQSLPSDPLERAMIGRNETTKAFLRKHPELIRGDGSLKRAAIDAHDKALDDGFAEGSNEYFARIEKILEDDKAPAGEPNGARPAPGYAAPVERGAAPGATGPLRADGTFQMTSKMRQLAADAGVSNQEWATNYMRLLKEGRITPIT